MSKFTITNDSDFPLTVCPASGETITLPSVRNAAADMLTALKEISESYLGDCPASQDELAHAMAHIQRMRNRAHEAVAAATGEK